MHRLQAFVKLGNFLRAYCEYASEGQLKKETTAFSDFDDKIDLARHKNGWFTRKNVLYSIQYWGDQLAPENLTNWSTKYDLISKRSINVGLVMAGNIPLVGFHDFLMTLLTGNRALIKLSSNDEILMPLVTRRLIQFEPSLKNHISFVTNKLKDFDAVIATGSDNTARYFEYYFRETPHIIRKNRNSIAVLTGNESENQLQALGEDIFRYFGLGCRNVSKIYVPKGYNFESFFKAMYRHKDIIQHAKYANNYDYNKAVYLMSDFKILDNGFMILKKEESLGSPIATIFYEEYDTVNHLKEKITAERGSVQCIVSSGFSDDEINFGQTQQPTLTDYADGIDTAKFLIDTEKAEV